MEDITKKEVLDAIYALIATTKQEITKQVSINVEDSKNSCEILSEIDINRDTELTEVLEEEDIIAYSYYNGLTQDVPLMLRLYNSGGFRSFQGYTADTLSTNSRTFRPSTYRSLFQR